MIQLGGALDSLSLTKEHHHEHHLRRVRVFLPRPLCFGPDPGSQRLATPSTETKSAYKTTELIAFIAAVVGVLIASAIIDENDAGGFGARQAWLYVTILTVG